MAPGYSTEPGIARSRIREGAAPVVGLASLMTTQATYFIAMDDHTHNRGWTNLAKNLQTMTPTVVARIWRHVGGFGGSNVKGEDTPAAMEPGSVVKGVERDRELKC